MNIEHIVAIVFAAGFLTGLVAYHAVYHTFSWRRDTRALLFDFQRQFPDRCPICSFHNYGISHGHLNPNHPISPHRCPHHGGEMWPSNDKEKTNANDLI